MSRGVQIHPDERNLVCRSRDCRILQKVRSRLRVGGASIVCIKLKQETRYSPSGAELSAGVADEIVHHAFQIRVCVRSWVVPEDRVIDAVDELIARAGTVLG